MAEDEKPTPDPEKPQLAIQAEPEKPPAEESVVEAEKPHELEPGGDRFKQVWARAKKAEDEARTERDGRIAAEARAKALEETKKQERPARYTAEQVWKAVEAGTVSQAEAMK